MPRRKKNINKKSLDFKESPRNIVRNLPSPVFGAEHPPTADVVTLNGSIAIPWVSPDAHLVRYPGAAGCRRDRRPVQKVDHKNTTVTPHTKHKPNKKLKPLRFVGDETSKECSTAEDISLEELLSECEVELSRRGSVTRARLRTNRLSVERSSEKKRSISEPHPHNDSRTWSPVLRTRTAKIHRTRKKRQGHKVKTNLENVFNSDSDISLLEHERDKKPRLRDEQELELENDTQCIRTDANLSLSQLADVTQKFIGSSPALDNMSHMKYLSDIATPDLAEDGCCKGRDRSYQQVGHVENREKCDKNAESPCENTQHRPRSNRRKNKRRLFSEQSSFNGLNSSKISPNSKSRVTPGKENVEMISRGQLLGSYFSPSKAQRRRSMRLMRLFSCTDSPIRTINKPLHILVYDTPEEDYDLPVRKRRLKNWRN